MFNHIRRGYGGVACRISFFIIAIQYFVFIPQAHAGDPAYLSDLLARAQNLNLHEDPYWHILVQYKSSLSGYKSLVDDRRFFLAPDGKTNPEAELQATIRAFFSKSEDADISSVCRFPARFEWIKESLGIDPGKLPVSECRTFENFMEKVKPESVTLIFPAAHLNSPASMFGHTLLTIETGNRSRLLAYAVNYTAVTNETFGPLFAFKGLFGLYPGYFSIMPYYSKLQEYSDFDHRDIWEYPLNLTVPEIRKMMLHTREMDGIASDYYFFDENCSYDLMFLLEAARPSAELTDQVHGWLIPLDSIRLIDEQGFVAGVQYRPSRTTKIKYLASHISEWAQDRALALANGDAVEDQPSNPSETDEEKIRTLDLAGEYLQYLYSKKKLPQETYQQRFLKILKERSLMGMPGDASSLQIPQPVAPDKGHDSNRYAMGAGIKRDEGFAEIRIRPAYHSLMDSDEGYVEGAQLIFTDLAFRYYAKENKFELECLDVIDIISLTPRDKFFSPISWKVKTGLMRIAGEADDDHLVYEVNPGGGFAYKYDSLGLLYFMFETDAKVSGALENDFSLGAGGSLGVMKLLTSRWKAHVFTRGISYGLGDRFSSLEGTLQQSYFINADQGISIDLSRRRTRGFYHNEAKALWSYFF